MFLVVVVVVVSFSISLLSPLLLGEYNDEVVETMFRTCTAVVWTGC